MGRTRSAPFITVPAAVQPEHAFAAEVAVVDRSAVPQTADIYGLIPHIIIAVVRRITPWRIVIIIGIASVRVRVAIIGGIAVSRRGWRIGRRRRGIAVI